MRPAQLFAIGSVILSLFLIWLENQK